MVYFPPTSTLGLAVRLGSMLLWTAHAITLAVALPPPQVPPLHATPTPGPPSPLLADGKDVRWSPRTVGIVDGISDLDSFGNTTGNATGEPMNVPMGWVDPRLRGGRMLDVGPSAIELPRHTEHLLTKPSV